MFAFGMPIEDVLRSATIIAAQVLQQDKLGQIKPDFIADLIVVNEDPVANLTTLRQPLLVIRDGQVVINRLDD